MSVQHTALRIAPTWSNKGLRVTGWAAVREKVQVTLVGAADVANSVVVRVFASSGAMISCGQSEKSQKFDLTRFPLQDGDVWTVDGEDLTCVMNFNTDGLIRIFRGFGATDEIEVCISVEDGTYDNLYALGVLRVKNWLVSDGDPVPGSSALVEKTEEIEEKIEEHTHDGEDSALIRHNVLLDAGSMTHDQLESKVGALEEGISDVGARLGEHALDKSNPHNVTAAQVGALTAAQVASAIMRHNASGGSHGDIRLELTNNSIILNSVVDSLNEAETKVPEFDPENVVDYDMRVQVAAITNFLRGLGL